MEGGTARAVPLSCADGVLRPVVLLLSATLSAHQARGLLSEQVPHADAVHNASRAALLVHALAGTPELLLEATEDRLHQEQRAPGMPESIELMRVLRRGGHPAVVSGAGPSVLGAVRPSQQPCPRWCDASSLIPPPGGSPRCRCGKFPLPLW